jgi:iron complex transport system substrate-binding protein
MPVPYRSISARICRHVSLVIFLSCSLLLLSACTAPGSAATAPSPTVAPEPTALLRATAQPTPSVTTAIATATAISSAGAESPQLPATVTDINDQAVTVTSVERIISLNGDITEIVFALGLGANLVGVDISASFPPEAAELPKIGYQRSLNAEGLLALNPTVVIGDEAAGPPEVLQQVSAAGVPVVIGADPITLDSPLQKVRFVAEALGVPERGAALVEQIRADFAAAQALREQATSPAPRVLFFYLRGTTTQAVAGKDTPVDVMITAAGGINAAAEAGLAGFESLSPETVVAAQPDVFLVLEHGLESVGGVDGLLAIPGLAETPAGRDRRVVAMDDLYLIGMGPRAGQALQDLTQAFHPELAE